MRQHFKGKYVKLYVYKIFLFTILLLKQMKPLLQLLTVSTVILVYFSCTYLSSQETAEKPSIGRGSIESQFNYVLYKSEKSEDYKLVRAWWLYTLKTQVLDTLKALHGNLEDTQNLLSVKNNEIDSLKTSVQAANKKLDNALKDKNSIVLLGIKTSKRAYNSITLFIIAALSVFLSVFIILFKRSNAASARIKSELSESREEFEEYRKRSLVREQQVVRQLYDEILKYKSKLKL